MDGERQLFGDSGERGICIYSIGGVAGADALFLVPKIFISLSQGWS